jgi:hypothetical protein
MSGIFTVLDNDQWKEITDRHVNNAGVVFAGKEYSQDYEVKLFVRKIES